MSTVHMEDQKTAHHSGRALARSRCGLGDYEVRKADESMVYISPVEGMLGTEADITCEACILLGFQKAAEMSDA